MCAPSLVQFASTNNNNIVCVCVCVVAANILPTENCVCVLFDGEAMRVCV